MNHRQVCKFIKKSQNILITTHMNPDLDAICSELTLAEYLRSQKKKVLILHEKPLAPMYHVLPGYRQIQALPASPFDYDVMIVVDCGELERIGGTQKILIKNKPIINIDHHLTNDRFGHLNIVDPKASSTAEVIFEMLSSWNVKLSKKMAEHLYLGIMTDTGSFRYQNTTSRTHQIAARLLKFGLSPASFYRRAYEDLNAQGFKLLLTAMNQVRYFDHGRVVSLSLSRHALKQAKGAFDLKDKIFYVLRMMQDVEVVVLFSQVAPEQTRVNFRSTGKVNVAALAQLFGGGGHKAASGCILAQNSKQAQHMVLKEILRKMV